METAGSFVSKRKTVVLNPAATISDAGRAMEKNRIGTVLVSSGDGHVWIVTDRDLMRALTCDELPPDATLADLVMGAEDAISVTSEESISKALELMVTHGIRRIPVVDDRNGRRPTGIISLDDFIMRRTFPVERLAPVLKSQELGPRRRFFPRPSEARREQTYRNFVNRYAKRIAMPPEQAEAGMRRALVMLVRRLTPEEAFEFTSQLPARLYDYLLDQKAGPDRSIDAERFVSEVAAAANCAPHVAREMIAELWAELRERTGNGELDDVLAQMPRDLRDLLTGAPPKSREGRVNLGA